MLEIALKRTRTRIVYRLPAGLAEYMNLIKLALGEGSHSYIVQNNRKNHITSEY